MRRKCITLGSVTLRSVPQTALPLIAALSAMDRPFHGTQFLLIHMATIYRKTDKGQTEIETRLYRLAPRLRTALILVDGRRNDAELGKMIPGDPETSLAALLNEGFIEVSHDHEHRGAMRPGVGPAGHSPAAPVHSFEQHRRDAIKSLTDQVGPAAESLAMRMEKCSSWNQLLPVLQLAQQVLRSSSGTAAAEDFGRRFLDVRPG